MSAKNILIPLDFSPCAINALRYAVAYADMVDARLFLLHGYHIPVATAEYQVSADMSLEKELEAEARTEFDKLLEEVPQLKRIDYTTLIEMGLIHDLIRDCIKAKGVDLIIMGTTAKDGLIAKMLGSNTYDVIKEVEVPLLAIPETAGFEKVDQIVFASDFRKIEDFSTLHALKEMAMSFGASIAIVNVKEHVEDTSMDEAYEAKKLDRYFNKIDHSFHSVTSNNVVEGIGQFLEDHGTNMMALMPRHHNVVGKLFKPSVTKEFALHLQLPLFAFHK